MNTLKKKLSLLLAAAMLAVSLTACGNSGDSSSAAEESSQPATDASQTADTSEAGDTGVIETLYDPNFTIEVLEDGIKKVTDGDGRELVLVPKALSEVPEEYSDSTVIRTPVENAVFLSSTQVCTFRTVDNDDLISAIGGVEGTSYDWSDIPAIAEALDNGSIVSVGDGYSDPDYEQIQALDPDVVFVYGGEYGQQAQMEKFDELGINYAVDNEYLESSYLARMEWMRFLLTFFDADSDADAALANVKTTVDSVKEQIEDIENPVVAIFNIYDGVVYPTADTTWMGDMLADMGGTNAFSELLETGNVTYEAAYECIADADVIIYSSTPMYTNGVDGIIDAFPELTECEAYKNGRAYQYTDIYWHGIDQSDVMAADLAAVLYPDVFADRELSYFVGLE